MKPVCVFYYGGWNGSVRDRLIDNRPKYVVSDWGVWPSIPNADVAAIVAAGITFCAYIPPGGMRGYKYRPDNVPQTPELIRQLIDNALAKGFNGVFFDEGGVYAPWHNPDPTGGQALYGDRMLQAPGTDGTTFYNGKTLRSLAAGYSDYDIPTAELWKGLTFETGYTDYAKSKGLFVCLNLGINGLVDNLNPNVFESRSVDAILSSEDYNSRDSQGPMGVEIGHEKKCWVLSYSGVYDAPATQVALDMGFAAAYCCENMGSLSSNFEPYMSQIEDEDEPLPNVEVVKRLRAVVTYKSDGIDKPLVGVPIRFTLNGNESAGTTDGNGVAVATVNLNPNINYTAKASFFGDSGNLPAESNEVSIVNKRNEVAINLTVEDA